MRRRNVHIAKTYPHFMSVKTFKKNKKNRISLKFWGQVSDLGTIVWSGDKKCQKIVKKINHLRVLML